MLSYLSFIFLLGAQDKHEDAETSGRRPRGEASGKWRCFAGGGLGALSPQRGSGRSHENFLKGSIFECKKQTILPD